MKDRFLFFENFRRMADCLPDDMQLKFYKSLMSYVFDDAEPDDPVIKSLITAIKPSLNKEEKRGGNHNPTGQNQHNKFKPENNEVKVGQNNKELGQSEVKVGQTFFETEQKERKEKKNSPLNPQEKNKINKNIYPENNKLFSAPLAKKPNVGEAAGETMDIEELIAKLKSQEEKDKVKKFIPPTVGEVSAYCEERGNSVNPGRFVDFYACKGWMVGKNKMKDWRAAVRNWEKETKSEGHTIGDWL